LKRTLYDPMHGPRYEEPFDFLSVKKRCEHSWKFRRGLGPIEVTPGRLKYVVLCSDFLPSVCQAAFRPRMRI